MLRSFEVAGVGAGVVCKVRNKTRNRHIKLNFFVHINISILKVKCVLIYDEEKYIIWT